MMSYVICKHPAVKMSLMVPERFWADIVSMAKRTGCTYAKEEHVEPIKDNKYVIIRDIQSNYGNKLGEFLSYIHGIENILASNPEIPVAQKKFYIMINTRNAKKVKKGKNNAKEVRKEVHSGSEGRNSGESTGDIRPGEDPVTCEDSGISDRSGASDILEQE